MQQIYKRALMPKCNFALWYMCSPVNFLHIFITPFCKNSPGWLLEITLWHGCYPVNLLHILRTAFSKNTFWWLLLNVITSEPVVCRCPQKWLFWKTSQITRTVSRNREIHLAQVTYFLGYIITHERDTKRNKTRVREEVFHEKKIATA